jgi:para-nitrobenzyl esterase
MHRLVLAAAAACIALGLSPAGRAADTAADVTIDTGALAGVSDGAIDVFKGIPFAAPPVGPLRWEPPAPPAHWATRDATAFGPICPQPVRMDAGGFLTRDFKQSEDCLSLNVWAPHGAKNAPVMVWIHGGAHRLGTGSSPIYDGANFARDGVVFVTINYRLGLLGYFAHPALTKAAAPEAPLGNYGQMDQIAALKWVQRNIAAFGGDPRNVTVFGESAGGASILWLMATPSSKGLFTKAIVESGGGWSKPSSLAEQEAQGTAFAVKAGLADATAEQLRALPVEKTFDVPLALGFGPFVDGRLVKETPAQAFADGSAIQVPLIIGSNSFEASLMKTFELTPDAMLSRLTPQARALFAPAGASDEKVAEAVFTDAVMGAPAHWVAEEDALHAPAYLYHFSYVASMRRQGSEGAAHGSEIPYVFATGSALAQRFFITLGDDDRAMEARMHECWVAFAKNGKPACGGADWPAISATNDALMEFGTDSGVRTDFRKPRYDALGAAMLPTLSLSPH